MAEKKLKTGFSTGTAATAAAQAALELLLAGTSPKKVEVKLPQRGGLIRIPIIKARLISSSEAEAVVVKDAGDDPDVTNKARILARVILIDFEANTNRVTIDGGVGVGRVTRPGLPVAVGRAAINPVPRRMISLGVKAVWKKIKGKQPFQARVIIEVPAGAALAKKTLNPRLGIIGGISILGTSGLVKPFSHEAYTATISSGLDVARAMGESGIVFTTGGKSEKAARKIFLNLPDFAFVQIADYYGFALAEAAKRGFQKVMLVSYFGKAIKQAQGLECTHAHKAKLDLMLLADWFKRAGAKNKVVQEIESANTARHALSILAENNSLDLVKTVGRRMAASAARLAGGSLNIEARILDYDNEVLYQVSKRRNKK